VYWKSAPIPTDEVNILRSRTSAREELTHLLDDVPQFTVRFEVHQSVVDGHVVEFRFLLVAEKRVRYPQAVPAVFSETYLLDSGAELPECQTRIAPLLS